METVITRLDAEVEEKNWELLKNDYNEETIKVPNNIYQSFLIQSKSKPNSWRIITQWRSLKDLEKMRQSTAVPVAVKIFKKAGATPVLGVWNVLVQKVNNTSPLFNLS